MNSRIYRIAALIIGITAVGSLAAPKLWSQASSSGQQPERFQRSFAITSAGTLAVDNYKGDYFKYFMDIRAGKVPGRVNPKQVTFFINAGTQGLQFAACAGRVVELAKQKKMGRELPTEWFLQDIRD